MKPVKDNPYHIQAVERTLLLLNCFTAEKFEWTLTELSEAIGVNKSTVFRILTTLQTYQYLKQTGVSQKREVSAKTLTSLHFAKKLLKCC